MQKCISPHTVLPFREIRKIASLEQGDTLTCVAVIDDTYLQKASMFLMAKSLLESVVLPQK